MSDFNSEQSQVPVQTINKPMSVTVFGVLNIVFGFLGLLISLISIYGMVTASEKLGLFGPYKVFLLVMNVIGFGFSVWLLILGIGLLKLSKWARRGSVMYVLLSIPYAIFETGINIVALLLGWITIPEDAVAGAIVSTCVGMCGGLIYPVLLLIFMQRAKVKEAFLAIGGIC